MRPRERLFHEGAARLDDAELVAVLLGAGVRGRPAGAIAAALLADGLGALARREPGELGLVPGIGPARAARLAAAIELGRRVLAVPTADGAPVNTAAAAYRWLGPGLDGLLEEELHALYLDRRLRPIARRRLTRGSDGFTVVDPRQVFRPAVALHAKALVMAHNHPTGDPTPSAHDREVTRRVAAAGRVLGIGLVDHLVVGGGRYASMAEMGELPGWDSDDHSWMAEP